MVLNKFFQLPRILKIYGKAYIMVDIHGTILKPSYNNEPGKPYPWALETLRILSKDSRIILILWSSCKKSKLLEYQEYFKNQGIEFNYLMRFRTQGMQTSQRNLILWMINLDFLLPYGLSCIYS